MAVRLSQDYRGVLKIGKSNSTHTYIYSVVLAKGSIPTFIQTGDLSTARAWNQGFHYNRVKMLTKVAFSSDHKLAMPTQLASSTQIHRPGL